MLLINHILKRLQKRPVEAHQGHTLTQPTSLFRQEACGFTDAVECHTIDVGVDLLVFSPTADRRDPPIPYIRPFTFNDFTFNQPGD
jgi:hypothetical protein